MIDTATALDAPPLLAIDHLKKYFPIRKGVFGRVAARVHAVDDVSFTLSPGETLGLVGESGCGKTTVGRALLRLIEPTAGAVTYREPGSPTPTDVLSLRGRSLRAFRQKAQIIFQDPFGSLNPRQTVMGIVGEPLKIHGLARGKERRGIVESLLREVGLSPKYINRYPHEFSGGQRQRIGIARALALSPRFIVCDEPVSALDVSIQAQILNLLAELQQRRGMSYLFIAHNLHVVEHISDRVAVMYLGQIVETAPYRDLYARPLHPYTRALLSANPEPDPRAVAARQRKRVVLEGTVPTPIDPPAGCRFHPRCPVAARHPELWPACKTVTPPARTTPEGHLVRCHLYGGADGKHGPVEPDTRFPESTKTD